MKHTCTILSLFLYIFPLKTTSILIISLFARKDFFLETTVNVSSREVPVQGFDVKDSENARQAERKKSIVGRKNAFMKALI